MSGTETILLVMADPVRRAWAFSLLADRPQRIVRGFGNAADAIDALEPGVGACMIVDANGLETDAMRKLLGAASDHPALVTLVLADALDIGATLALVRAHPADIAPRSIGGPALADRAARLVQLAQQLSDQWRDRTAAIGALGRLSPRERAVLAALAQGRTSKDIARALSVSPRTVEVHRASIMRRTGSETLAQLLRFYFLVELGAGQERSIAA